MRINTNISALNAYRNLSMTDNRLSKSLERLSSGLRINRAADDAAGLAISEKMRGQIRGLNQAMRNAMDGISLLQTAEGALNETHSILQRMRELSVQAASDTLTSSDRIEIQREIEQLTSEMNRISSSTEFNTKKLLDGSSAALTSTSELNTKIFMRGGLRTIDQFGQKAVGGGNYRLEIEANPGQGEVQKTDIMKLKHGSVEPASSVEIVESGGEARGKVYVFDISGATSGDYYLSSGDEPPLMFVLGTDDAGSIQAALEGWDSIGEGNVTVSGSDAEGYTIALSPAVGDLVIDFNFDELEGVMGIPRLVGPITEYSMEMTQAWKEFWVSRGDFDDISFGGFAVYAVEGGLYDGEAGNAVQVEFVAGASGDELVSLNTTTNVITVSLQGEASQQIADIVSALESLDDFRAEVVEAGVTEIAVADLGDLSVSSLDGGSDYTNEAFDLRLPGVASGTYRLGDGSQEIILSRNDDAAAIQAALSTIASFNGAVTVTEVLGIDGLFEIVFAAPQMSGPSGLQFENIDLRGEGGEATYEETAPYVPGGNAQQRVSIAGAESGSFRIIFTNPADGLQYPSGLIAWNADAEAVRAALIEVPGIGEGDVTVTLENGSYEISFGGGLSNTLIAPLEVNTSGLSGRSSVGSVAVIDSSLFDIDRFWDANGNFLVQDPQTINLVQGDGKKTKITIFGSDTIRDIGDKLNSAIHEGLGQSEFNEVADSYVTYVTSEMAAENENGFFTVAGTFVIQSAVTGKDGEIRFSGDEGVINALSLTTLQKSKENEFTISVTDAHNSDKVIAENIRIVGNMLVGVVHENVDVKFNPMAGVTIDATDRAFRWAGGDTEQVFIHLSDNTMVFHIGANPGQDVSAAIGDMSAEALGVDNILVTNRESANRAISQLDYAIGRVSSERAKMGALQNRLEHTINNLGVAAENLSAAESRVRDLDFALEMVEFTRNQIMMQAGTSMLAQANMKPQSVLMLLQ